MQRPRTDTYACVRAAYLRTERPLSTDNLCTATEHFLHVLHMLLFATSLPHSPVYLPLARKSFFFLAIVSHDSQVSEQGRWR
jgi:hypothetical protein